MIEQPTNRNGIERKEATKTEHNKQTNKQTIKQKQFQCQPCLLAKVSKAREDWKQNFEFWTTL